jgi:hypothetical protein
MRVAYEGGAKTRPMFSLAPTAGGLSAALTLRF